VASSSVIVTEGLRKEYPAPGNGTTAAVALERIDLVVADHEIVSIVGPSGCGKTTLLNLLAGFEPPTAGRVLVRGHLVAEPSPERGVVFQQPALFPWLTVWDNVTMGPRMRGVDPERLRRDATKVLMSVGLRGFASHYPYQLSGGMRQRVQIARVLVASPDVMLMDEPFGSLDFQTRLIMHEVLLKLWAEYRPTIVFITHDVEEALFLADRVYVMSHRPGRIKAEIPVPFAKPRRYEITAEPAFGGLKAAVIAMLRNEWQDQEASLEDGMAP
jgi:NitT/TauT family transport system ATP-binding protein